MSGQLDPAPERRQQRGPLEVGGSPRRALLGLVGLPRLERVPGDEPAAVQLLDVQLGGDDAQLQQQGEERSGHALHRRSVADAAEDVRQPWSDRSPAPCRRRPGGQAAPGRCGRTEQRVGQRHRTGADARPSDAPVAGRRRAERAVPRQRPAQAGRPGRSGDRTARTKRGRKPAAARASQAPSRPAVPSMARRASATSAPPAGRPTAVAAVEAGRGLVRSAAAPSPAPGGRRARRSGCAGTGVPSWRPSHSCDVAERRRSGRRPRPSPSGWSRRAPPARPPPGWPGCGRRARRR